MAKPERAPVFSSGKTIKTESAAPARRPDAKQAPTQRMEKAKVIPIRKDTASTPVPEKPRASWWNRLKESWQAKKWEKMEQIGTTRWNEEQAKAKTMAEADEAVYRTYDALPKDKLTTRLEIALPHLKRKAEPQPAVPTSENLVATSESEDDFPEITIDLDESDIKTVAPPLSAAVKYDLPRTAKPPTEAADYAEMTIQNPKEEKEFAYLRTVAEKFAHAVEVMDPAQTMAFQEWLVQNKNILPLSEKYLKDNPHDAKYLQQQGVDLKKLKSILPPEVDFE